MKILIDIPEDTHERITRPDRLFTDDDVNKICWAVYNGIPIPDNATNGDIVQMMFPNVNVYEHNGGATYSVNNEYNFNATWWNAPYQKGGK